MVDDVGGEVCMLGVGCLLYWCRSVRGCRWGLMGCWVTRQLDTLVACGPRGHVVVVTREEEWCLVAGARVYGTFTGKPSPDPRLRIQCCSVALVY